MKETFLFVFLYVLRYIRVQSLESQLAIAPFQPDFSFKSLQKYLEFSGWIGKMKTSSRCMQTEGSGAQVHRPATNTTTNTNLLHNSSNT